MPWQEVSTVSLRNEFIGLISQPGANFAELCRRFGISRKTGQKWRQRYRDRGIDGLEDTSRRPHQSPRLTPAAMTEAVLSIRSSHPSWGGRKIMARLRALGHEAVPAASTITEILRRNGCLDPGEAAKHKAWQRFEHDSPNRLWQMDYKGHFPIETGRCHPLTVLDDHSRFSLCLEACSNERGETVQAALTETFRRYGLPERMLMDNGPPWGLPEYPGVHTSLTVWLLRLGIQVSHGRPFHPQTQGKEERFHRTLEAEVIRWHAFRDLAACQHRFDAWRQIYNHERPHEALGLGVPVDHYRPSWRRFPEALPPIEYGPDDVVRKVQNKGVISLRGCFYRIGKAFCGYPVAVRPTETDGLLAVYFCQERVASIDLRITVEQ